MHRNNRFCRWTPYFFWICVRLLSIRIQFSTGTLISKNFLYIAGKLPLDRKITHFHSPLKQIQTKIRRILLHLLENVKSELKRMEKEGHMVKLNKCDEDCFISPIVITRKNDGSIKLALDSKLPKNMILKNKYQMPIIRELIDNIALQNKISGEVWFSILVLKNAYSQLQLCYNARIQCSFSIVGRETNGTYHF